jgi:hypothetical protein
MGKAPSGTVMSMFTDVVGPGPGRPALEAVVVKFTPELIDGELFFPGDRDRPPALIKVADYLVGLAWHDPLHVIDMLRALPERSDDPALAEWVGPLRARLP